MKKGSMVGVRLTQEELDKLDVHTKQLSRAQVIRILIQDFLEKPEQQQREFLFQRLYGQ